MLAAHHVPTLPDAAWLVPAAILLLIALGRLDGWPSRWLLAALAATAWTCIHAHARLGERLPDALTGADFDVVGWVDDFPTGTAARRTFSFRVARADHPGVPRRLRLGWYDAPATLEAGAAFHLTVRLRAPRGTVNPGGFDYERWLLLEGYGATGYVRAGTVAAGTDGGAARRFMRLRHEIATALTRTAPSESAAGLLTALAIGERYAFTMSQWTALRRSGTSHLVAISGLHVGLIAALVFVAVRRIWLRLPIRFAIFDLEAASVLALAAAIGYAALAGFALPTQRAVVMLVVALAVVVARRNIQPRTGLAVAALAVTVLDPFALLSVSFWLSFGAVAMLLWLAAARVPRARSCSVVATWRGRAAALVALQLGLSFGLAPVTALFFGEVSLVSPFANLLAIPYFSFALVPATLLAVGMLSLGVPGAEHVVHAAGVLAEWAWLGIEAASRPEWAAFGLPGAPAPLAALALVGATAALPAHPLPGRRLAWLALLPLVWPGASRVPSGAADVTMLDVGHGLSVVVETATHRLVYDAGPRFGSGYDSGAAVVVPLLAQRSWLGLDLLVLSHAHNDHAGGASAVLAAYPDAGVLKGPDVERYPGRACATGQRWAWDDVVFEVLHPPTDFAWRGNESSCVLKIVTRFGAVLITGDVEARAERMLARLPGSAADIVVVAHHGSATSSSRGFVAASGARHALVSAAHANQWGFPHADVVRRWRDAGADVWVTADAGAVTVRLRQDGFSVLSERTSKARYWRPK